MCGARLGAAPPAPRHRGCAGVTVTPPGAHPEGVGTGKAVGLCAAGGGGSIAPAGRCRRRGGGAGGASRHCLAALAALRRRAGPRGRCLPSSRLRRVRRPNPPLCRAARWPRLGHAFGGGLRWPGGASVTAPRCSLPRAVPPPPPVPLPGVTPRPASPPHLRSPRRWEPSPTAPPPLRRGRHRHRRRRQLTATLRSGPPLAGHAGGSARRRQELHRSQTSARRRDGPGSN